MGNEFQIKAYEIISEFINAINANDTNLLKDKFNISAAILEEIHETIEAFFKKRPLLKLAPLKEAFDHEKKSRPFIDIFEMNDKNTWGVECVLWVDDKASEAILHVELNNGGDELTLSYKYIGS